MSKDNGKLVTSENVGFSHGCKRNPRFFTASQVNMGNRFWALVSSVVGKEVAMRRPSGI